MLSPVVRGMMTAEIRQGGSFMKFINQRDYPHLPYVTRTDMEKEEDRAAGKTTTVASSACGVCCAVMVADRLLPNCDFDLSQAISLSYETKANYRRGTTYARFAPAFAEKLGLRYETTDDLQVLRNCLHTGGVAVALVQGDRDGKVGLFTHRGHYITVLNEEPDGRFAVLDPYFYPQKFDEEGREGKVELKNNVLILCSGEILLEEGKQDSAPFHLFWRK